MNYFKEMTDKTEPMDWKSFTQWREPNNHFEERPDVMRMPKMDWKHSTPIPRPVLSPIQLIKFESNYRKMTRVMNKMTKLFKMLSLDA